MLDVGIFTHLSIFCVGPFYRLSPFCGMKRNTPFQIHHAVEFGLQICERSAGASITVVTTVCQFCKVAIKEEAVVGRKRSFLDRVNYFKAPFRKDKYSSNNRRMHSAAI